MHFAITYFPFLFHRRRVCQITNTESDEITNIIIEMGVFTSAFDKAERIKCQMKLLDLLRIFYKNHTFNVLCIRDFFNKLQYVHSIIYLLVTLFIRYFFFFFNFQILILISFFSLCPFIELDDYIFKLFIDMYYSISLEVKYYWIEKNV